MNEPAIAVVVIGILGIFFVYYYKFLLRRARYPEIQKFCEWYKNQQELKGLNLFGISLYPSGIYSRLSGSELLHLDGLTIQIGTRVNFTPPMIDELMTYISNCKRTEGFDYFENVCAEVLRIEKLLEQGETKPLPGLF